MSDTLAREEQAAQNKNIPPGGGTADQQKVGPATDESIEEQNRPGQSAENEQQATEAKQGEDLQKEKNQSQKNQPGSEEANFKRNLQAAGSKPGASPALQAAAKASKIPVIGGLYASLVVKLLHLTRLLNAIGVMSLILAPFTLGSYIVSSIMIGTLRNYSVRKIILSTIMITSAIKEDFQYVLGNKAVTQTTQTDNGQNGAKKGSTIIRRQKQNTARDQKSRFKANKLRQSQQAAAPPRQAA